MTNLVILQESRVFRGWTLKGAHGYYADKMENISFSIILAFSGYKFYWLIINKSTNIPHIFHHFLVELIAIRERVQNNSDNNIVLSMITQVFIKPNRLEESRLKIRYIF